MVPEQFDDLGDLVVASHERRQLRRQIVRQLVERTQRGELLRQIGGDELVDLLGLSEIFEPVRSQNREGCSAPAWCLKQVRRRARNEHLAAVTDREQPRDAIDGGAKIVAVAFRSRCRCAAPMRTRMPRRRKNLHPRACAVPRAPAAMASSGSAKAA